MATIKAIIRSRKNKEGKHPILIRITENRKSSFIATGQSIDEKHWDKQGCRVKKGHPNSVRLNNLIAKKLANANDTLLELTSKDGLISSKQVSKQVKGASGHFFALADQYVENDQKSGKYNVSKSNASRVKNFKAFLGGQNIDFREITPLKLKSFQAWLRGTKNLSDRTIVNHLILIRTIYNLAINEGLVDQKHYPFGRGKITVSIPDSEKIGLEDYEVQALEKLELSSKAQRHALNVWLFSLYFAGVRVGDLLKLKWTDFEGDRLFYAMGKNAKAGSLKISAKAMAILDQYRELNHPSGTVFPELGHKDLSNAKAVGRAINSADRKFNRHLEKIAEQAGITKSLTMHIARHTFGNLSGDKIPLQMLQKLYRHSSITTTINYQKAFMFKDADEALESVIG